MKFKIEGWFPPCIIKAPMTGVRYACCGSSWVEISENTTMEDVMEGWVCTAPDWKPRVVKPAAKKITKKQLFDAVKTNSVQPIAKTNSVQPMLKKKMLK